MIYEKNGVKLGYEVKGNGMPIIFLHGYVGTKEQMQAFFESIFQIDDKFRRIYVDSPGNGQSNAPEFIKKPDDIFDVMKQFICDITQDSKFLLVGYSFGGHMSLGMLTTALKDRIEGVLLLSPYIWSQNDNKLPKAEVRKVDKEIFDSLDADVQKAINSNETAVVVVSKNVLKFQPYFEKAFSLRNQPFLDKIRENTLNCSFHSEINNLTYEKPVLILTGRQDSSVGYKLQLSLGEKLSKATIIILDAAGHGLPAEYHDLLCMTTKEWLERVEYNMK